MGETTPTAADLIKALNHPIRRSLLRFLLDHGAVDSVKARQAFTVHMAPSLVNFHLDNLAKYGAVVRHKRIGHRPKLYCHTKAIEGEWVRAVLNLTAAEDEILAAAEALR